MKALICYDTKYGSTRSVCEEIASGMNIETDIRKVDEVQSFNYDIIVVGSPVFVGLPLPSVIEFLKANWERLENKHIALFVTCWAASTRYHEASADFIEVLKAELPTCHLVNAQALPGKLLMDEISETDRKIMTRLIRRIRNMSQEFGEEDVMWRDARDQQQAHQFGKETVNRLNQFESSAGRSS